jgi:hypothetical protein
MIKTEDNENIFDIKFSIDDQLFWETFKIMLRGKIISYSTFKKKERENNVVTSNQYNYHQHPPSVV